MLLLMNASFPSRSTITHRWGRYTEDEVEAIVDGYAELTGYRQKPYLQVRLLDVERGLRRTSLVYAQAMFLVGMLGLSLREAGKVLGVSKDTVYRRYSRGIQELTRKLNGGR